MAWDIDIKHKIYQRLADEIFFRVYRGIYLPVTKLPTYLALAKEAGSSPETVRKAIRALQEHYLAVIEQEYAVAKAKIRK